MLLNIGSNQEIVARYIVWLYRLIKQDRDRDLLI